MPETVTKFQPDRTLALRGFDGRGAAAALYGATASSFKVSGVFRDPSDFTVLVVYDADDFFGHPRIKYLPDFSLSGMVLEFDLHYAGLQPLDSPKFPTISWPYLDVIRADGSTTQIKLSSYATPVGAGPVAASTTFAIAANSVALGDTLTLWYQNLSWQYPAGGGDTAGAVESYLAAQINSTDWALAGGSYTLSAAGGGGGLTITANPAGYDGNMIRIYSIASAPSRLSAIPGTAQLAGGSSDVTWHVKLDFSALGIDSVRQMWLTFAPQLADSALYSSTNWDATFTNWSITADPNGLSALKVAGPGSVRVEETDVWCSYSGNSWTSTDVGWFSKGFAQVASTLGDSVSINYWCQHPHDLWVGTELYVDRGMFAVKVDGVGLAPVDLYLNTVSPVDTRRKIASSLAPGQHTVTLTVAASNPASQGPFCYFDFIEAVVASAVPDAPGPWLNRMPAIDYDTDHGYKLSPARLMWMFDKLGFSASNVPIDEYIGVFWWNQRKVTGQILASATVTFGAGFAVGDSIFLNIGGTEIGKTVFAHEDATIWALHFAYFINETFSGVWASAAGNILTIYTRSTSAAYQFSFSASFTSSGGTLSWSGGLNGSTPGTWIVDPSQSPALNYGAQCWHQDLFAQVFARGESIVSAFSMELVDTPDDPSHGHVWVARFPDGTPVLTSTGFGSLNSAQCVPLAPEFLAYQQQAYLHVAQLQAAAGLTPQLQCGEFLWWFFANAGGMAYYDQVTNAAAAADLGRALWPFLTPNDDPSVNGYADANFLASRLNAHVAQIVSYVKARVANALFEILFPYDVNGPTVTPISQVGGRLNAYVNFPVAWQAQGTAPFDLFKLEQLAFSTTDRNLNLVKSGLTAIRTLDWPLSKLRYLYPIDNAGMPQWAEYRLAIAAGFLYLTPFAFDHVNLLNWPVEPPALQVGAQIL